MLLEALVVPYRSFTFLLEHGRCSNLLHPFRVSGRACLQKLFDLIYECSLGSKINFDLVHQSIFALLDCEQHVIVLQLQVICLVAKLLADLLEPINSKPSFSR